MRILRRGDPGFGIANVYPSTQPGTTYCDDCHRPMMSHRYLGDNLICPEHPLWDRDLPRWEP